MNSRLKKQNNPTNLIKCTNETLNKHLNLLPYVCVHAQSLQSCLTLCDPVDCSQPGSSVHGILQARILKRVAISSSRGSSQARDWTSISCTEGGFFTHWATWETPTLYLAFLNKKSFVRERIYVSTIPSVLKNCLGKSKIELSEDITLGRF